MTRPRIYTTSFASVYPLYVSQAEKKGRTKEEVDKMDELIDELAKGRPTEKILRK